MAIEFDDSGFSPLKLQETELAGRIITELVKHYPGYEWHVTVDLETGMAMVRTEFSGKFGVRGPVQDFFNDPEMKVLVNHVGEFLERYRLSRERANSEAIDMLLVRPDGRPLADADAIPVGSR